MKTTKKLSILFFSLVALFLASCTSSAPDGQGKTTVKVTDSPFPFSFATEANVGISKIELKNDSTGQYVTVYESTASGSGSYNLLQYQNGKTADVATNDLPVGTYKYARVTFNNASVKMNGKTGSGNDFFDFSSSANGSYEEQVSPALVVEHTGTSNVLIDVNVNKTFQFQGSGGFFGSWFTSLSSIMGCSFKPEFRVCDLDKTGSISGNVTINGKATANANVTLTVNGKEVAANTDANGNYKIIGVEQGTYSVTATTSDNVTVSNNVTVSGTANASCNFTK